MSDQDAKPSRPLSEISHLFLSSIRDAAGNGAPRPQRTPPPSTIKAKANVSMDLTPEEYAQVFGSEAPDAITPTETDRIAPVTAVIGAHLTPGATGFNRVKQYARHLAAPRRRIGLIEADASEFRLTCFDGTVGASATDGETAPSESYDPRRMAEAIAELNWDVDRWLLFLPNPRTPEARALLRDVGDWTLLSTCDHDGVVACYRTLKGLTDSHGRNRAEARPRLSLALLDAADDESADRVFRKLASVCQQFLDWPLHAQLAVREAHAVAEHLVVSCRPTRDKGQLGAPPQWQIVGNFLARAKAAQPAPAEADVDHRESVADDQAVTAQVPPAVSAPFAQHEEPMRIMPTPPATERAAEPAAKLTMSSGGDDVIDLLADESVLPAILRHRSGELVACPIVPPMSDQAQLAVARDRRLVMVGEAGAGLAHLRDIGRAYQWLVENRTLIAMAVPQLAIDPNQMPRLTLLIDHADASAATLQPMLQSGHVTIETYRKLKWAGKTGLLLEAA